MDEGLAALSGALIGGFTTWLTTWAVELRRERRTGRSVAIAAASELDAMIKLANARGFPAGVKSAYEQAKSGVVVHVDAHVRDDYLPSCRAALAHAGAIHNNLASLLAKAIVLADGLTSDFRRLSAHPPGDPKSLLNSPEDAARVYGDLVSIFEAVTTVGSEVVALVSKTYPPKRSLAERFNWRRLYLGLCVMVVVATAVWFAVAKPSYVEAVGAVHGDCEAAEGYAELLRQRDAADLAAAKADALATGGDVGVEPGLFDDLIPTKAESPVEGCAPETLRRAIESRYVAMTQSWFNQSAQFLLATLLALAALFFAGLLVARSRMKRFSETR